MTSQFASGGNIGCEPVGSWLKVNHSGYEDEEVLGEKNHRVDGNGQRDHSNKAHHDKIGFFSHLAQLSWCHHDSPHD